MINFLKKKYLYALWKPFSFFVTRNKTSMHNFLFNPTYMYWVGLVSTHMMSWIGLKISQSGKIWKNHPIQPHLTYSLSYLWLKRILINETQLPWPMLFLYLLDKFDSFNGRKISLLKAPKSVSWVTRVLMIYP